MSETQSEQTPKNEKPSVDARLAGLEKWAYETFNTNNPIQIPAGGRKWIAENVWWLAAVGGVLTLIGAVGMVNMANWWSAMNRDYYAIGYAPIVNLSLWWYTLLAITVLEGVVLLIAAKKLKAMQKSGWNLLFYLSLLGIIMGIVSALTPGYGIGSLIGAAIGVAISWTILMQIRSYLK